MTGFLLQSMLCQALFFIIYKGWLERSKLHLFNRFYLLAVLLLPLLIPLLSFEIEVASAKPVVLLMPAAQVLQSSAAENRPDFWPVVLGSIYVGGLLVFGFRFAKNLSQINKTVRSNQTEKRDGVTYVLLPQLVQPHTFLRFIFVNEDEYRKKSLAAELFTHELSHARQHHSLDILAVEFLRAFFWFNPLLWMIKRSMQLNHEFLADETVLNRHGRVRHYQSLLLEKASFPYSSPLASCLTFSITKKRLIMMTKTTTPVLQTVRATAAILALMTISACFTVDAVAQQTPPAPPLPPAPVTMAPVAAPSPVPAPADVALASLPETPEKPSHRASLLPQTAEQDREASFPGGMAKFFEYFGSQFKWTAEASAANVQGRIITSFVVAKDGTLTDVKILRGLGYGLDEEVQRVIAASPKWNPATKDGTPVSAQLTLPVMIK